MCRWPTARRLEIEEADRVFCQHAGAASGSVGKPAGGRELLERVKAAALGAQAHQDIAFRAGGGAAAAAAQSVATAAVPGDVRLAEHTWVGELELPGLKLEVGGADRTSAKFDLTLIVARSAGADRGSLRV